MSSALHADALMAGEIWHMAETTPTVERPLSPHLSIYRPLINMVMSILHRLTGGALYFGTLLLAAWLMAAAMGREQFDMVNAAFAHPIGMVVLLGYTWALVHHMLGGMRHLIWDTGRGLQIPQVNALSWLTIIGSLALTSAIWAVGLALRGDL
jgi:succinate dehydrogenase / fumarate reductase, cytochrome b subunit